jgi:glycerate kinase
MRVLAALTGFKGSASAVEATRWVAEGLRVTLPDSIEVLERLIEPTDTSNAP